MKRLSWFVPLVGIVFAAWWDKLWLNRVVTFLVNYLAFTNAMRKLEPVIAPLQDVQGPFGWNATRLWTKQGWRIIMVRSCGICILINIAHLSLPKAEPYFILWGVFIHAAATVVATGLSTLEPEGRPQFVSRQAADIIAKIPLFQHVPVPYRRAVALLVAYLALFWATWFGLEQALPWVITWMSSNSTATGNALHMMKRGDPSTNASAVWGPAGMNAVVTLGCHVHKTWRDGQQDVATDIQHEAVVNHLATLVDQQSIMAEQLAALTSQLPSLIALAITQHLNAAINQSPITSNQQRHTTANLSVASVPHVITPAHSSNTAHGTDSTAVPMIEMTVLDSNGRPQSGRRSSV